MLQNTDGYCTTSRQAVSKWVILSLFSNRIVCKTTKTKIVYTEFLSEFVCYPCHLFPHSSDMELTETVGQLVLALSPSHKSLTWLSRDIYRWRRRRGTAKCWDKPPLTPTQFYIWTHKYKHIHSYLPNRYGGWDAWLATGGGDARNNPSCPETEIATLNLYGQPGLCLLAWEQDCTDAFYRTLELLKDYGMRKNKKIPSSSVLQAWLRFLLPTMYPLLLSSGAPASIRPRENLVWRHLPLTKHVWVGR